MAKVIPIARAEDGKEEMPFWFYAYYTEVRDHWCFYKNNSLWPFLKWAGVDKWSEKEGMLLLAGIYPDEAEIDWGKIDVSTPSHEHAVKNASLFDEPVSFLRIPCIGSNNIEEFSNAWESKNKSDISRCLIRKYDALSGANARLMEINFFWERTDHPKEEVKNGFARPGYFLEWALKNMELKIHWLDVAINQGLVEKSLEGSSSAVTPRKEASYLRLIAALKRCVLEGKKFHSQAQLIDFLEREYGTEGLKKTTLENTFSKANGLN